MSEKNPREIKTQGGRTFKLTKEAAGELGAELGISPEGKEEGFYDQLAARYEDRQKFYEQKGVPAEVFDETIWPGLAQKFTTGEADAVDEERARRSNNPY